MTSLPTFSVLAMCRNEEKDLPAFLQHLLPWVDEIVLIDDGSIDQTVAIAKGAGEKVNLICSPRSEGEYFSDKLNLGLKHVTSDWVIRMDIDERIPPALRREILAAICTPAWMDIAIIVTTSFCIDPSLEAAGSRGVLCVWFVMEAFALKARSTTNVFF